MSPVLKGRDGLGEVKAVCEALVEVGTLINKSCGFHAHFGTEDFSISVWRNLYVNYATLEDDVDAFMRSKTTAAMNLECTGHRSAR